MTPSQPRPDFVLVGLAPDPPSAVLDAAADAAAALDRDVVLLCVSPDEPWAEGAAPASAEVAAALVRSRSQGRTHVSIRTRVGSTVDILLEESSSAGLLVLGSDRDEGVLEVVHRDVITHVATRAACRVLVVHRRPESHQSHQPGASDAVVVAVDEEVCHSALRVGLAVARSTGRPLKVLHPWWPAASDTEDPAEESPVRTARLRDTITAQVEAAAASYPEVEVTTLVWRQWPAEALVAASLDAALMVISRGPAGPGSMSLIGRLVLREAGCPVLVA